VPENINTYAQLLRAQGTPEAEEKAWEVAMKGYQDTGQYTFGAFAGDIRVEQSSRRVAALRDKMEGGDGEARAAWEQAHRQHLDLRLAEVSERAREYPTDRTIRYQLGEIEFERARYTNAMQCFQEVKDEPRLRVRAGHMLGRCFAAENWHKEAIAEYQEALERIEPGAREVELQIRYDLMVSLMAHARDERSRDLALQALEICSSIARKDITYRDIRDCRRQLDELVRQLNPQPQEG
jgi:tetratricopeptide (TPR) repeat protein